MRTPPRLSCKDLMLTSMAAILCECGSMLTTARPTSKAPGRAWHGRSVVVLLVVLALLLVGGHHLQNLAGLEVDENLLNGFVLGYLDRKDGQPVLILHAAPDRLATSLQFC